MPMTVDSPQNLLPAEDSQEEVYDRLIIAIKEALHEDNEGVIQEIVAPLPPEDLAYLVERLTPDLRRQLFRAIKKNFDPEVLSYFTAPVLSSIVEELGIPQLALLLPRLESDDAFAVFEELGEDQQQALLSAIPKENRLRFEKLLTYPEDSAARIMQQEVVIVPAFWTVDAIVKYIQRSDTLPDEFYEIYVVNPKHMPVGKVSLNRLLRLKPNAIIADVMETEIRVLSAEEKQEEVSYLFRHYSLISAPVVDEDHRIIGMITADDVVDIMDEESQREIMQLAGVDNSYINAPVLKTSYHRMAGLLISFVNSFILMAIVYHYMDLIGKHVALVGLIPIVSGMSGASGTQVIAVTVRSLANRMISRTNTWRTIFKEAAIGSINGVCFSLALLIILMLWYSDWMLGVILVIALIFNMTWAALSGAILPIMVDRWGLDPAISTGPVLTALTDLLGFISLLALAKVFL